MAWYEPIKQLVQAIDGEYERRIRAASNVKGYHPEGGGHGHHAVTGHDHPALPEEEGQGSGTAGALQGGAESQYMTDQSVEQIVQH